jgi:hypothetical protein
MTKEWRVIAMCDAVWYGDSEEDVKRSVMSQAECISPEDWKAFIIIPLGEKKG